MVKSLGLALAVALGVLLVGFGALTLITRDASMLNASYLDEAARAAPAVIEGDVLDAPLDSGTADPSVRLETTREEAAKKAMSWLTSSVVAAALFSCIWLILAHRRSKSISGVQGQRSCTPHWWLMFAALAVVVAVAGYYVSARLGLAADVSAGTLQGSVTIVLLAAVVTYYLATAIGVSPTMRPSVPFATAWRR